MAQWKKVLVSGSLISELVNDLNFADINFVTASVATLSSSLETRLTTDETTITNNSSSFAARLTTDETTITNNSSSFASRLATEESFTSALSASQATRFETIESDIAGIGTDSASFESRITTNEGDITTLYAWSASLDNDFVSEVELSAYSASVASRDASQEADIAGLVTDSASFESRITDNDNDIAALVQDSASFSTRVTTNEGDIAGLVNDSASFSTRITDNDADIAALVVDSGSFSTRVTNLKTDSGSFSTRVTDLETATNSDSASFAARITDNDTDILNLQTDLAAEVAKTDAYTASFTTETLVVTGNAAVTGTFGVVGATSFGDDVIVEGNLTVNGDVTNVNTTNLNIEDKFITLASGSATLTDAGIIFQSNIAGTGPAMFLESTATGTYGRMAMAQNVASTDTVANPDAYVTTTEISPSAPAAAPIFGDTTNGYGNIHVNTATGDIYIYS